MGAHVGPSPAHIGHRRHTLGFRAATALFGHLGLELDVRTLNADERAELSAWIKTYKRFRGLLHGGRSHLFTQRQDAGRAGHGVVAADKSEALFAVVQLAASRLRLAPPARLPGLDAEADYTLALAGPPPPHVAFTTPGVAFAGRRPVAGVRRAVGQRRASDTHLTAGNRIAAARLQNANGIEFLVFPLPY